MFILACDLLLQIVTYTLKEIALICDWCISEIGSALTPETQVMIIQAVSSYKASIDSVNWYSYIQLHAIAAPDRPGHPDYM
jgi:hypothetical protein